jgi:predicted nucleotidyltransferase
MTVSVAKDKSDLKKRILRFFDEESSRKDVVSFLNQLSLITDIYVFGGLIRDIALHGIASFNSDIDLVFSGNEKHVVNFLSNYSAQINKFGGYRLKVSGWQIDIWKAKKSWAFEMGYVKYSDITSLLKTTITNWDSILFSWNHRAIICEDQYFQDINDGYLDVRLHHNPNEIGMYVRLLRYFSAKDAHLISAKAASFISEAIDRYTFQDLSSYEKHSYKQTFITQSIYTYLKAHKGITNPDLIPIDLDRFNKTLNLSLNAN